LQIQKFFHKILSWEKLIFLSVRMALMLTADVAVIPMQDLQPASAHRRQPDNPVRSWNRLVRRDAKETI
jgi:hypothetical protein